MTSARLTATAGRTARLGKLPPADDLQRRVGEAASHSFYAPGRARDWSGVIRWSAFVSCAGLCWGAVFGIGALLA